MRILLAILLTVVTAQGATYYVATTGNDTTGNGSQETPWLTIQKAANTAVAGDTVLVQPGTYLERVTPANAGTLGNPITYRGSGTATNYGWLNLKSYNIIDGFDVAGPLVLPGNTNITAFTGAIDIYKGKVGIQLLNNRIHDFDAAIMTLSGAGDTDANGVYRAAGLRGPWTNSAGYSIYASNETAIVGAYVEHGGTNLYKINSASSGTWTVVSGASPAPTSSNGGSKIRGISFEYAATAGAGCSDVVISNNVLRNLTYCGMQLFLSNAVVVGNTLDYFNSRDAMQVFGGNITISGNTFTNISTNPLVADHTDIIQSWGAEATDTNGVWIPNREAYNVFFERNLIVNCAAQVCQLEQKNCGAFTNWTFQNNLYINRVPDGQGGNCDLPYVKWFNNTFVNYTTNTSGPILLNYNAKGWTTNALVYNNIFYQCGSGNDGNGWYMPENLSAVTNNNLCDYNFVCGLDGVAKDAYPPDSSYRWGSYGWEAHGINGGSPSFVDTNNLNARLLYGSQLIGAGTNLYALGVTNDFEGNARPSTGAFDMGAFQYDPTLLLHLDWATNFSDGVVYDTTGRGHHGYRTSATNWPYSTNYSGRIGGRFTAIPGNVEAGTDIGWGDFVALTNLSGLNVLTQGTVSVWAHYYTNLNANDSGNARLFDAGYNGFVWSPGSWFLGRGYSPIYNSSWATVVRLYQSAGNAVTMLTFPDNTVSTSGDSGGWHHYVFTWDGTTNQNNLTAYFDGTNCYTTNLTTGFLQITNNYNWAALGCWTHNGTPQMGDTDTYPNNGWMNGTIGDTRVYNRALSSDEVASLYAGSGASMSASAPSEYIPPEIPPETNNPPASVGREMRAKTIHAGQIIRR